MLAFCWMTTGWPSLLAACGDSWLTHFAFLLQTDSWSSPLPSCLKIKATQVWVRCSFLGFVLPDFSGDLVDSHFRVDRVRWLLCHRLGLLLIYKELHQLLLKVFFFFCKQKRKQKLQSLTLESCEVSFFCCCLVSYKSENTFCESMQWCCES